MTRRQPLRGRPLQKAIVDRARSLGWLVAHTPPVRTDRGWRTAVAADGKGFPDLLMLRERILVAEVKGDGDRLSPEQRRWLTAFRLAGVTAFVWTPADWLDGGVDAALSARLPHVQGVDASIIDGALLDALSTILGTEATNSPPDAVVRT